MLEVGTKAPDFTLPDQNGEISWEESDSLFLPKRQYARMYETGVRIFREIHTVSGKGSACSWGEQRQRRFTQKI